MPKTGVLVYCFNTPTYRYDLIASKTIPLLQKNLRSDITVVTNTETKKCLEKLEHLENINFIILEPQKGNFIDQKPWYNLERHSAYNVSPYDNTILLDIDYFCYSDHLLDYVRTDHDFWIHDSVYDVTGKNSYEFSRNSIIPMLWATVIIFKKTQKVKAIFETVAHVKKFYQYYCSLYRVDFRNFRNDYAFSIAVHQIDGMISTNKIPVRLPTLPANAKVIRVDQSGIAWELDDKVGLVENMDLHVIDKGVAYV
jgi:hypothetical protein